MMGVETIWELSVPNRTLCLTLEVTNGDICFDKETGSERVGVGVGVGGRTLLVL